MLDFAAFVELTCYSIRLSTFCKSESADLLTIPDVVKGLCLMDHDAARGTFVAVEKVLHDTAFANCQRDEHNNFRSLKSTFRTKAAARAQKLSSWTSFMSYMCGGIL